MALPNPSRRVCDLGHTGCYLEAGAEEAGIRSTPPEPERDAYLARCRQCPRCLGWEDSDTCDRCGGTLWHEPGATPPDFAKLWAAVTAVQRDEWDRWQAEHWARICGVDVSGVLGVAP